MPPRWEKVLRRMLADTTPRNYRYLDAVAILEHFGFVLAPSGSGTSHRKWRGLRKDGVPVRVQLVQSGGNGLLKPYLVTQMLTELRAGGFLSALAVGDDANADTTFPSL